MDVFSVLFFLFAEFAIGYVIEQVRCIGVPGQIQLEKPALAQRILIDQLGHEKFRESGRGFRTTRPSAGSIPWYRSWVLTA